MTIKEYEECEVGLMKRIQRLRYMEKVRSED